MDVCQEGAAWKPATHPHPVLQQVQLRLQPSSVLLSSELGFHRSLQALAKVVLLGAAAAVAAAVRPGLRQLSLELLHLALEPARDQTRSKRGVM